MERLPNQVARERFSQLLEVSLGKTTLFDKLVKEGDKSSRYEAVSIRATLLGVIMDEMRASNVKLPEKKPWHLLCHIVENSPEPLGETLQNDIISVYSELNNIKREADNAQISKEVYVRILKTVSQFIAVISGLPIPEDIKEIINSQKDLGFPEEEPSESIEESDLIDNPTTRVPVVLCLDVSASMNLDNRIQQLNQGVKDFFNAIQEDSIAKWAAEICIVTFSNEAQKIVDFNYAGKQKEIFESMELKASGNTAIAAAVNMSLDLLEERKKEYRDARVGYWQPWLVIMTDGQSTENEEIITAASNRCSSMVQDGKLVLFPLAIGKGANIEELKKFSPKRAPLRLQDQKISEFFNWLSQSVRTTSQSSPGQDVKLPDVGSWALL